MKENCIDIRDNDSNLVDSIRFFEPHQLQLDFTNQVRVQSKKIWSDGTISVKLSNGRVHVGKPAYIKQLLKDRYNLCV